MDHNYEDIDTQEFNSEKNQTEGKSEKGKKGRNPFATVFVINVVLFILGVTTPIIEYFDIVIRSQPPLNLPFGLGIYSITSVLSGVIMGILLSWVLSASVKKYIENILLFAGFTSASFWTIFAYCSWRGNVLGIETLVFIVISSILLFGVFLIKSFLRKVSAKINVKREEQS